MGFRPAVLPASADDDLLGQTLGGLSSDRAITGILLQFPLPAHLSREKAVAAIAPGKDIDGVTPLNAGHFFTGRGRYFVPATPLGGLELLQRSAIPIDGRHAVIVGRSEIVGRPMALLLLRENATITICHSRTPDLARYTRQADILAVAVGHPGLITGEMVAPGAVVLDFGVNVVNGKVVGDVDFASAVDVAGAITPVPGGTGPMTNARFGPLGGWALMTVLNQSPAASVSYRQRTALYPARSRAVRVSLSLSHTAHHVARLRTLYL